MTQGHLQAVQPPQSHHIIYHLGAFTGFSTYHSHFTLYTTQGHLQAVQPTTVTPHYIPLRGIYRLLNLSQSLHIIYDLGAFAGCSTHHSHTTLYTTQGHLQASQPITVTSHYIRLRGTCRMFNHHSYNKLYTTQGHLQAVQPTTVTSHYIRLSGICSQFNPPQSHHIIYDLGAFVGCSTHHSHITLYTTQGHLQASQPITVTSHYIRLRGICRLFNPPQSHHIIYDLVAFVASSTHHSHITLHMTQGHLQAVQPPQSHHIIYDLGALAGCSTTTVTPHYIPLRGIYRLLNPSQSHHIIYDLGAFVGCSTHHSHITLYMTQGHLQAVQPPQSHHIIYHLGAFTGFSTYHSNFTLYTTQGICRLFNPPQSHHIIYDLGAFAGCSTHHSHTTLYMTQGHLQAVQPPQSHHIIYHLGAFTGFSTHHSHFTLYTTQGICRLFNPPQSHHIIYDLGALAGCSTTTVTPHYIPLRGIYRLLNLSQSLHIIYDLGAFAGCSTHHSHTTLYTTQGIYRLSQPITVTSHYIRLRGICRLFNPPQSHHIIYDLGAFVACSTHHSHITLYTNQGHLQAVQLSTVTSHYIRLRGTCRMFNHHSYNKLYTNQGHLQAVQLSTVTSHYIRLRGICRLFNPPQSHHIIYDLGAHAGCSTTTVTTHYIRLRGICRLFNPPQSHHIIYDLVAFVASSTHHSHITLYMTQGHLQAVQPPQSHHIIYHLGAFTGFSTYHSHFTLYTTQGHLQAVQPTTVTPHYIPLRGIYRLLNLSQSLHIIYDLGAFAGCSTHHSHITLYTIQGHLQAVQPTTVTSNYIRIRGICRLFNSPQSHHIIQDLGAFADCSTHHSHITLYTTQGHLQAVQPTTVTSHYIRLRGICRLFNPPQSHHIIYDLGAFVGCSTLHSHITLFTTQWHLQAVQPTTVTPHYIPLRGIYRLLNLSQSLHIIYDLGAFAGCSTHHSHITLFTTQGHLQPVQPTTVTSHYIRLRGICRLFNHHSHTTLYTTQGHLQASQPITVTSHYIRLRGICRLFNPPQSHHIIYDLGAFAGCSTYHSHITLYTNCSCICRLFNHHSHITLYTTQGHLQAVQPTTVTSHYIRLSFVGCSTHHSHITLYTTQGHLQDVQPPQLQQIIYDLGAFAGCSTHHSHITLYTTQGHLQPVQPTTVTSHYIRIRGICRLFNSPQSHHIIYDLGAFVAMFNPPQSHHIIYELGAFVGCSTLHSHITLYTTQGHLQAVQPTTVTSHYIRLRGICRLFNLSQSHHIIYDLGAFAGCSTHHSHITLYTTQWHLQPVQPTTVTSHYIRLRGICRLFNHHSHTTLYTTQGHLQASQPITVTSHYIRLRGICRLFNPPQSHHIIYHLGAFTGFSTYHSHFTLYTTQGHLQAVQPTTVTSHYIRFRGICRLFNPPQSHQIIYELEAFVGCSTLHSHITLYRTQGHLQTVQPTTVTSHYIRLRGICRLFNHHSHITLYTTQGHLQAVQPTTVTSHYIRLRGICRLFNSPQSHHIIYDLGAFVGCSTHHSHITLYTTQGHLQAVSTYHSHFTLYTTQGHLQAVQPTTVTSHYLRLSGICSQFNPPQSHHIIYDLGAFAGCSTHHSHITLYTTQGHLQAFNLPQSHFTLYTTQGHLQAVQPTTVTSHYIRLRAHLGCSTNHSHITLYTTICSLFNPPQFTGSPQSHHIITTQGHMQDVQPPQLQHNYIRLRGICRLFNPPQSHHIIYDLGAFVACSTHHSHITLYTTQGHLQAVQLSTVTSHYIRLRGICRLFNPPQSQHIIYDLGAFAGCSTHHSHITLYTTQGHLQAVQPTTVTSHYIRLRGICRLFNHHSHTTLYTTQGHLQASQPITVTSHYIRLRGICRLFNPPQSHHIIYDLVAFVEPTRGICRLFNLPQFTSHYIRLRGICRLFNPPQSHHIIYDLGAFAGCSTHHSHITLYTTQGHLQAVQPTTVTSHYIRLRGICRLFNPPQSHHIIYDLGAFVGCSTHHSHITLYTTQGHLQAVQPPQSHHIIYELGAFVGCSTHHSHITLYTTQWHLQPVQPTTVTSHYI